MGKEARTIDLTLSKRADYAVRAAIALGRAWPERRTIRAVALATGVSEAFTPHVLRSLVRAGMVDARAGRAGGYALAVAPQEVRILNIVEAAEGPLTTTRCTLRGGACYWENVCPMHRTWSDAIIALRSVLHSATLSEVIARDIDLELGVLEIPADSHRLSRSTGPLP